MGRLRRNTIMMVTALVLLSAGAVAAYLAHQGTAAPPKAPEADPALRGQVTPAADAGTAVDARGLRAPTRFMSPEGNDRGTCTHADPCLTLNRAYHVAQPGDVVELAGGSYGQQTVTPDDNKNGRGCVSRSRAAACVVFAPARGATVDFVSIDFGESYGTPGPRGIALIAGDGRTLKVGTTVFNQAVEVGLRDVDQKLMYITGGRDLAIRGGSVGGTKLPDGTHPEIQRVYGSKPLIVPQRLTIAGVRFHDINTTSPTAHVDCLQIENGRGIVLKDNRFERCGSVGLRMSYGADGNEAPPEHVLIEGNDFGSCVRTPVSECYYSAQLGVGRHVVVRGNRSDQAFQPAGGPQFATAVKYEKNVAPGVKCEAGVQYIANVWTEERCSTSDRLVRTLPKP